MNSDGTQIDCETRWLSVVETTTTINYKGNSMERISEKVEDEFWDKIDDEYLFAPHYTGEKYRWINLPEPHKKYSLGSLWTDAQEMLVNSFFAELTENLIALDWQHECFKFSPSEKSAFAETLPTYYPDGDYHFFIDEKWCFGLFGHPWLGEIIVLGSDLIQKFDENLSELNITVID